MNSIQETSKTAAQHNSFISKDTAIERESRCGIPNRQYDSFTVHYAKRVNLGQTQHCGRGKSTCERLVPCFQRD
jgi:hypothetical protein